MYKNEAYIIRTKTNLHAGSGDTNFGIVDKQVQRDSISNLPIINSSSLKGAIRDHFSDLLAQTNDIAVDSDFVKPFVPTFVVNPKRNKFLSCNMFHTFSFVAINLYSLLSHF